MTNQEPDSGNEINANTNEAMIPKRKVISQIRSLIYALEPHGFPPSDQAEEMIDHLSKLAAFVDDYQG